MAEVVSSPRAVSPLRAFRGALICLLEGSADTSMLHMACHMTLAQIEELDVDSTGAASCILQYLLTNVQAQKGVLYYAYVTLHSMLVALCDALIDEEGSN